MRRRRKPAPPRPEAHPCVASRIHRAARSFIAASTFAAVNLQSFPRRASRSRTCGSFLDGRPWFYSDGRRGSFLDGRRDETAVQHTQKDTPASRAKSARSGHDVDAQTMQACSSGSAHLSRSRSCSIWFSDTSAPPRTPAGWSQMATSPCFRSRMDLRSGGASRMCPAQSALYL